MRVIPMLAYEDGAAAIEWLTNAFGFREELRHVSDDGTITHAELETGAGVIMLATPTPDYVSPKRLREISTEARKMAEVPYVIDGVLVGVDDVDAHFARARDTGATILSEPEDVPESASGTTGSRTRKATAGCSPRSSSKSQDDSRRGRGSSLARAAVCFFKR